MSPICLIPARIGSTRFPRKPLVDIAGSPMISRVVSNCLAAFGAGNVYVATDSTEIALVAEAAGAKAIMVTKNCETGTDRIAHALQHLKAVDWVFNVQGDEPALLPSEMTEFVNKTVSGNAEVTNAYRIENELVRIQSPNSIKMAVGLSGRLMYASRAPIPYTVPPEGVKLQVCIYGFRPRMLEEYLVKGRTSGSLEQFENVEILRFVENGHNVHMIEIKTQSHPIDVPEDVAIVEKIISRTN